MQQTEKTFDLGLLNEHREKWKNSPGLRACYASLYREMMDHAATVPGRVLEIGSGGGFIRDFFPEVVTSDLSRSPAIDREASAYDLQALGESWASVLALDVFHHLREPWRFLESASQVVLPGGRIVLMEPAATAWGRIFYRLFHHEPCRPAAIAAPYRFPGQPGEPLFANMGMAWAIFGRDQTSTSTALAELGLNIGLVHYRDCLAYPATGGFSGPTLMPASWIRKLLAAEKRIPSSIFRYIGLRMLVVLEKKE